MKVILFNGSRNEKGSTYTALNLVADSLKENGIETEIFWVGGKALTGQIDSLVDEAIEKLQNADGMVLGSPRRNYSLSRCPKQVHHLRTAAGNNITLLEHGSWLKR